MQEKTKTIRIAAELHQRIKMEAVKRRFNLEFFAAEVIRAGLRFYAKPNGGSK